MCSCRPVPTLCSAMQLYIDLPAGAGLSYSTDPADYATDGALGAPCCWHARQQHAGTAACIWELKQCLGPPDPQARGTLHLQQAARPVPGCRVALKAGRPAVGFPNVACRLPDAAGRARCAAGLPQQTWSQASSASVSQHAGLPGHPRFLRADLQTTQDLYAALLGFFGDLFPAFQENDFYIAGESYAGIYVPLTGEQRSRV